MTSEVGTCRGVWLCRGFALGVRRRVHRRARGFGGFGGFGGFVEHGRRERRSGRIQLDHDGGLRRIGRKWLGRGGRWPDR